MQKDVNRLQVLIHLLSEKYQKEFNFGSFDEWRLNFGQMSQSWDNSFDRAIIGGFYADRLAYAFEAGYVSALQYLVPSLPLNSIAALCVTEEKGGHPRAINTWLKKIEKDKEPGKMILSGKKQFVTGAKEAQILIVAASAGYDGNGRNQIKMIQIDSMSRGVFIEKMPDLCFIPEINHGIVIFDNVEVKEDQILPGDGYLNYIKPFRTIEDIHITASVLGYLFSLAMRFGCPRSYKEQMIYQILGLKEISFNNPLSPEIHIALGGFNQFFEIFLKNVEPFLEKIPEEIRKRWNRDKQILNVANNAREKRLMTAWGKI